MTQPGETSEMDDVAERAERGRVFYEMFPGTPVSDRWLHEFERDNAGERGAADGGPEDRRTKENRR